MTIFRYFPKLPFYKTAKWTVYSLPTIPLHQDMLLLNSLLTGITWGNFHRTARANIHESVVTLCCLHHRYHGLFSIWRMSSWVWGSSCKYKTVLYIVALSIFRKLSHGLCLLRIKATDIDANASKVDCPKQSWLHTTIENRSYKEFSLCL